MFGAVAKRLFGSANDRLVKSLRKTVDAINALEPTVAALSDEAAAAPRPTSSASGWRKGETLDDLLVEAFAIVREAAKRTLGQRHFDVQLIGGMVLHQGDIAEMKTGEGKTLVATLAAYLNALPGQGRPRRHRQRLPGPARRRLDGARSTSFLGLCGRLSSSRSWTRPSGARPMPATSPTAPTTSSASTICATTCAIAREQMVQRGHNYAIVDEVDSILIDEARTPLIICGPTEDSSELYRTVDQLMPQLVPEDWEKDEKQRSGHADREGPASTSRRCSSEAGLLKSARPLRHRERDARPPRQPGACARTSCSAATSTTSSRTTRSSSSTSSPAA